MPPIGERMASVETEVGRVRLDLAEVKADVKQLVTWMNEERGARRQRQLTRRQVVAILSAISTLAGAIGALVVKVL